VVFLLQSSQNIEPPASRILRTFSRTAEASKVIVEKFIDKGGRRWMTKMNHQRQNLQLSPHGLGNSAQEADESTLDFCRIWAGDYVYDEAMADHKDGLWLNSSLNSARSDEAQIKIAG